MSLLYRDTSLQVVSAAFSSPFRLPPCSSLHKLYDPMVGRARISVDSRCTYECESIKPPSQDYALNTFSPHSLSILLSMKHFPTYDRACTSIRIIQLPFLSSSFSFFFFFFQSSIVIVDTVSMIEETFYITRFQGGLLLQEFITRLIFDSSSKGLETLVHCNRVPIFRIIQRKNNERITGCTQIFLEVGKLHCFCKPTMFIIKFIEHVGGMFVIRRKDRVSLDLLSSYCWGNILLARSLHLVLSWIYMLNKQKKWLITVTRCAWKRLTIVLIYDVACYDR